MRKKIIIASFILVVFVPQLASARIVPECNHPGQPPGCNLCDFFLLIKNIFDFVAYVMVPTAGALIILIAGFLFLTSGGSEQKIGQARKLLFGVVIGAAIVYTSWIGVGLIMNTIGKGIDGWTPQSWNKFTCG